MLKDQDLPNSLWVEATRTAVYIQNRCHPAILEDRTPEEAFTGMKPEIDHLKVFGCHVYVHIPKEKQTKMDPSEKKGVFVDYSETSKAYRIYIPSQRQIEVCRDVTFHEKAALRKSKDLQLETEVEPASPLTETSDSESHREDNHDDPMDHITPLEPVENLERSLEDPPRKRNPAWFKITMQNAEKVTAPKGTFRGSKRPHRYTGYVAFISKIVDSKPTTFEEANKLQVWKEAMQEEYNSIIKNNVWEVVPRPTDKSIVSSKWIFKLKHVVDGSIEKYKAKFVARGFSQKEGIDYDETFAPMARYTSIRTIISLVSIFGWNMYQMDVKTAFLNGNIDQEVFIEQPEASVLHSKESHVCRLIKVLYGLKQAPRVWYERRDGFLKDLGFQNHDDDSNIYLRVIKNQPLFLVLYVDDLFLTGEDSLINWCKKELINEFAMKDLGLLHYFLVLEVQQSKDEVFLSQGKYTVDILKRFSMLDCKSMTTPMVTNLKKLHDLDTGSNLVDPTMYKQ